MAWLIALLSVLLEATRLCWHGRLQGNPWHIAGHAVLAAVLAAMMHPWLALPAVLSVVVSASLLDSKRRNEWPGRWASGLSAYPWHLCAIVGALGWPDGLPGAWPDSWATAWALRPSAWILAGLPIGWLAGLPWVSWLRPDHWTPSPKSILYPVRLRLALGGR